MSDDTRPTPAERIAVSRFALARATEFVRHGNHVLTGVPVSEAELQPLLTRLNQIEAEMQAFRSTLVKKISERT